MSLLVFEGNSGVGKSTIAALSARALGASLLHFPPAFVRFRRATDLDRSVGARARLAYYLGASLHLAELVSRELERGTVVCDRYWASPFSLLEAEGSLTRSEIDRSIASSLASVPVPGITLHLTASHVEASRRVRARARGRRLTGDEELTVDSRSFFDAREDATRRRSEELGPVVEIDTTRLSPEEVVAAVLSVVQDHAPTLQGS